MGDSHDSLAKGKVAVIVDAVEKMLIASSVRIQRSLLEAANLSANPDILLNVLLPTTTVETSFSAHLDKKRRIGE